jgi:predicted nucleotidyltransferase
MLRAEFGASQVVLFGSLARDEFRLQSDIDLAAWGIQRDEYFVAVAHVLDIAEEFKVDLVEGEHTRPALAAAIVREGVAL